MLLADETPDGLMNACLTFLSTVPDRFLVRSPGREVQGGR